MSADSRDLNYDKYFVEGQVGGEEVKAYTSHNTKLLDVNKTAEKLIATDYIKEMLK